MGDLTRYGDDPELTRATRRAALRVGLAVVLLVLAITASGLLLVLKLGAHAIFTGGAMRIAGQVIGVVHWWGLVVAVLVVSTGVTVWLLRSHDDAHLPRQVDDVPAESPAAQALARLASLSDVPLPRLVLVDTPQRNAFVVEGRQCPATICLSRAAYVELPADQLEAVLAHELFHVAHGDTRLSRRLEQIAATADRKAPDVVSDFVLKAVRAMMRQRELSADRAAALLTGKPSAVADALQSCAGPAAGIPTRDLRAAMSLAFVSVHQSSLRHWADTHPSLPERAEVLARVAASLGSR
jgi:heat shock protein HtpX